MSDEKAPERPAPILDAYFRNIMVLNQALSEPGQAFRNSHAPAQPGSQAYERAVLWLGCNVLRTPHLGQLATNVVLLLNPELAVLGGRLHCCGSPMPKKSDRERALGITVDGLRKEQAGTVISWCPSCHTNLRNGSESSGWGFEELHITEFIARHLERLKLRPRNPIRVMLHGHTGTPDRDKDMQYCRKILEAIPGITVVGESCDVDLGLHCVPMMLEPKIGAEAFEQKLQGILNQVRECSADMLVTIYHSCYRELEKRLISSLSSTAADEIEASGAGNQPLAADAQKTAKMPVIENYITLLAKALDLPLPANLYREVAHADSARLVQITSEVESRLLDRSELEGAIRAEFPSAQFRR